MVKKVGDLEVSELESMFNNARSDIIERASENATVNILEKMGFNIGKDLVEIQADVKFLRTARLFIKKIMLACLSGFLLIIGYTTLYSWVEKSIDKLGEF